MLKCKFSSNPPKLGIVMLQQHQSWKSDSGLIRFAHQQSQLSLVLMNIYSFVCPAVGILSLKEEFLSCTYSK